MDKFKAFVVGTGVGLVGGAFLLALDMVYAAKKKDGIWLIDGEGIHVLADKSKIKIVPVEENEEE